MSRYNLFFMTNLLTNIIFSSTFNTQSLGVSEYFLERERERERERETNRQLVARVYNKNQSLTQGNLTNISLHFVQKQQSHRMEFSVRWLCCFCIPPFLFASTRESFYLTQNTFYLTQNTFYPTQNTFYPTQNTFYLTQNTFYSTQKVIEKCETEHGFTQYLPES